MRHDEFSDRIYPSVAVAVACSRVVFRVVPIFSVLHMLVMVLSISVLSGINFKYELPNTRNELILLVDGSFSGSETEEAKNNFVQAVLNECEPEMRVGIVTFGFNQVYAAPLTTDKSRAYRQYLEAEKPDGSATDIASALQYAGGIFENPQSGKIVLLTDGDETDRSASAVIRTIAASGITVDTVHFPAERNAARLQRGGGGFLQNRAYFAKLFRRRRKRNLA